jgi:hypothetical protein
MLCFPQMATKSQITAEQYLHMTFDHDTEFVHGELVERGLLDLAQVDVLESPIGVNSEPLGQRIYHPDVGNIPDALALADYPLELTPGVLFSDL